MLSTTSSLDVKLGLRMLVKHRWLTVIGGFAMAVAIAVGAIFFEVVSELLRPSVPVEDGGRMVALQYATDDPGSPERRILHDFLDWREQLTTVRQVGAFRTVKHNLSLSPGSTEVIDVAELTASGFAVARTPPRLGRYLLPADERAGAPPVLVIGHDVWLSRFAGDPDVVGRTIRVGQVPHTVVGVMPSGFRFPVSHQFWIPLRADPAEHQRLQGPELFVFGRLAPGATIAEARAELAALGRRAAAASPATHARLHPRVLPYPREHLEGLDHPLAAQGLWLLQLLVSGLLVVVAVNLAILVYARTVARHGEIAVRSALGASRRRILGQLFVESFALSLLGAVVGLGMAQGVLGWIVSRLSVTDDIPFWIDLDLSPGTVVYALVLAALAAAIMGVLPGLKATGRRMYGSLRELGGGSGARLGRVWTTLIVGQVAIAVAVLPVAVFAVWKVARMELTEVGFPEERFVVGTVMLKSPAASPGPAPADEGSFLARLGARQVELARRLEAEPGVAAVSFSSRIPGLEGESRGLELAAGRSPADRSEAEAGPIRVDPRAFEVYGARILAGRTLEPGDLGAAAVVVNHAFVRRYLPGRSPLGQRIRYTDENGAAEGWYEIVGVVEDFPAVPMEAFAPSDGVPNVYHPAVPGGSYLGALTVRFRGPVPAGFAGRMRQIGAEIDPAMQLNGRPLAELYGSLRSGSRFLAWGLALVTSTVLLLSAAGIYALMSFTVAQRTREIGIRAALGAYPGRILAGILGRVARQLALGLVIGSLVSSAVFAVMELSVVRSAVLLAAVAGIMATVGLLAAMGPARRGLRIEPTEALRADG